MKGIRFDGACLYCVSAFTASFRGADLSGAQLRGADLKEGDFTNALLANAHLGVNTLGGATSLQGANFFNVDVTGVVWQGAHYDASTIFP